ncbi:hypothetical protein DFH08DRAFT_877214 [Mycena albidolilacea]|uniref:G domain-containing protein n=1 Tax=Mycena albidolilacea TaxID=1033008 RepID=A0AAD7ELQ5_9AGAR|nr:hypothetical protein DFH08DRAFT_877214 [Mycena albidolilacea]
MNRQKFSKRRLPSIPFRVLVIGRANAGKTSILQRVCETTESPVIYRTSLNVDGTKRREKVILHPSSERGEHKIRDELVFANHEGYVFHDSRGFESGSEEELRRVQKFVMDKSQEKKLKDRLHAIWFCIPMDSERPGLDMLHFNDICPDRNEVPLVAVFTKYDAFMHMMRCKVEDDDDGAGLPAENQAQTVFENEFLSRLDEKHKYVRLEARETLR